MYSNQMEKRVLSAKKKDKWYYVRRFEGLWSVEGELIVMGKAAKLGVNVLALLQHIVSLQEAGPQQFPASVRRGVF